MDTNVRVVDVTLPDGSHARAESYRAEVIALVSPQAFAPGQPLPMLASTGEGEPVSLIGKAIGSKRRADGAFDVRVRLHSMRREQRVWLESVFAATPSA